MATAWCSVASAIGTTSRSVATPSPYCTDAAPRKANSAKRDARGERMAKPTTRVTMDAPTVSVASSRWSNCTAAMFSVRFRSNGSSLA